MTDHPIRRLARLLREAEEVCQDQICALASDWSGPAAVQAKKAKEALQRARLHAGACLGLLILAQDPDAFRPDPADEETTS